MVRSIWLRTVAAMLASTGLVWGQQPMNVPVPASGAGDKVVTVQEMGKPGQKCHVVKTWRTPEGARAFQVQSLANGEMLTIIESGPVTMPLDSSAGSRVQAITTRIFHWGRRGSPPAGAPIPPMEVVQSQEPPLNNPAAATTKQAPIVQAKLTPEPLPVITNQNDNYGSHAIAGNRGPGKSTTVEIGSSSGLPVVQSGPSTTTTTYPSGPVIINETEMTPAPTGPGHRVKEMASRLFHREHSETLPAPSGPQIVVQSSQTTTTQLSSPPPAGTPVMVQSTSPSGTRLIPSTVAQTGYPNAWPAAFAQQSAVTQTTVPTPSKVVSNTPGTGCPTCNATGPDCGCQTPSQPTIVQTVPGDPNCCGRLVPPGKLPVLSSLFHRDSKPQTVITETVPVSPTAKTPAIISTTQAPTSKPATEPAKPTDWRQSWGKLDAQKLEVAKTTSKSPPPASAALPKADTKKPDPLKDPEPYTRLDKDATSKGKKDDFKFSMPPSPVPATKDETPAASGSAGATGNHPLGTKSVYDAGSPKYVPVPIVTVPDYRRPPQPPSAHVPQPPTPNTYLDMSNAFTNRTAGPVSAPNSQASNAFSPARSGEASPAMAGAFGPMGPGNQVPGAYPPPGYAAPLAQGAYQQSGYPQVNLAAYPSNAATMGQGVRPAGYYPQAGQHQVAMANTAAAYPNQLIPTSQGTNQAEAITTLRDSVYPSQREWAAGRLATLDWRMHSEVVQALTTAARQDPAATVRAACVRSLGSMKVNTMPVISTLQALKTDGDPRVLHEVEQALSVLAPEPGSSAVQPAKLTTR